MKYRIINSDVYAGLACLENETVQVAITSPPYWAQRDYGFDEQIGNEATYDEYIQKLVTIFALLRDKLSPDGVFFLNIGDKYLSKYGKTPLLFIPYKLAYFMKKDGWLLEDILIWYKPNHMPTSVKNRFANSYEPVFVFSKNKENIFSQRQSSTKYSNILKINIQPTPYKHVAVYPEALVDKLLQLVTLKENDTVLDPFAGSGTTLKVIKDKYPHLNGIMIECNSSYVEIIKQRCALENLFIEKYDQVPLKVTAVSYAHQHQQRTLFEQSPKYYTNSFYLKGDNGIFFLAKDQPDYFQFLEKLHRKTLSDLKKDGIVFVGAEQFDINLIYQTSLLNNKGWIIRNMIVIEKDNKWFPVFMLVDDNKKYNYLFDYKILNIKPKSEESKNWASVDFTGYKVVDNMSKQKNEGIIIKKSDTYPNGFPKYVQVLWKDGTVTNEYVILSEDETDSNVIITNTFNIIEKEEIIPLNNIMYSQKSAQSVLHTVYAPTNNIHVKKIMVNSKTKRELIWVPRQVPEHRYKKSILFVNGCIE